MWADRSPASLLTPWDSSWQTVPFEAPYIKKDLEDQLEEVQRKARGMIRALENVTCDERLKRLGLFKSGEGKAKERHDNSA